MIRNNNLERVPLLLISTWVRRIVMWAGRSGMCLARGK